MEQLIIAAIALAITGVAMAYDYWDHNRKRVSAMAALPDFVGEHAQEGDA